MSSKKIVLILGLAGFAVMADNWVVSPILPAISADFGTTLARASIIITAYMIPFGIFQLFFGFLADKIGKMRVITFAMAFFSVATGLCAIASGLTGLAVFRALTGVFAASVMPISLALIGDVFTVETRQGAIGTFMGVSFLGQGLSMAIGGAIAFFLNWRGVFSLYAAFAAVATILLFTVGKDIPSGKRGTADAVSVYRDLLRNRFHRGIYVLVFFEGAFLLGSFSFIGGFLKSAFSCNDLMVGIIMTVFGVAAILGGRVSGKISSRFGRKRTLTIGLACAVAADLTLAVSGSTILAAIVGIGLLGLGFMLAHSTFLTVATEFAPKARGVAMSLVAFCFMSGGGSGTAVGSLMVSDRVFSGVFRSYGIGLLGLLIVVLFLKKRAIESAA